MGLLNDILHSTGFRSDREYHRHEAYDRGEITKETLREAERLQAQEREAASRLTVADYDRKYRR